MRYAPDLYRPDRVPRHRQVYQHCRNVLGYCFSTGWLYHCQTCPDSARLELWPRDALYTLDRRQRRTNDPSGTDRQRVVRLARGLFRSTTCCPGCRCHMQLRPTRPTVSCRSIRSHAVSLQSEYVWDPSRSPGYRSFRKRADLRDSWCCLGQALARVQRT